MRFRESRGLEGPPGEKGCLPTRRKVFGPRAEEQRQAAPQGRVLMTAPFEARYHRGPPGSARLPESPSSGQAGHTVCRRPVTGGAIWSPAHVRGGATRPIFSLPCVLRRTRREEQHEREGNRDHQSRERLLGYVHHKGAISRSAQTHRRQHFGRKRGQADREACLHRLEQVLRQRAGAAGLAAQAVLSVVQMPDRFGRGVRSNV